MTDKMKIHLGGREIEADAVEFTAVKEEWSSYKLKNGDVIELKPIVTNIYHSGDIDPITKEPIYIVKSQNVMRTVRT